MGLDPIFAALAGRRCFITWRPVPIPDKPGKFDKVPYDVFTGRDSNAQDPATWVTAEQARDYVAQDVHVGIVLRDNPGLFCVDLDGALQEDNTWSAFAQWALSCFPGACVEVSYSGRGLHIFGTCGPIPEHRTKPVKARPFPIELYTRKRFIALSGGHMTGNPLVDHTAAVLGVIAHCLPEPVETDGDDWTTGPWAGWRGGGTDEQIIAGMMNRAGAHAIFGDGASFADLWTANADALGAAYPPNANSRKHEAFDRSSADQALANHLAWATGWDCERTERLMWGSALARGKWDRDDYLRRTIKRAVAGKIPTEPALTVPSAPATVPAGPTTTQPPVSGFVAGPTESAPDGRKPAITGAAVSGTPDPAGAALVSLPSPSTVVASAVPAAPVSVKRRTLPPPGSYITASDQPGFFEGCIYIEDMNQMLMPDGSILDKQQFNVHFGGFEFQTRTDGSKPTNDAWACFVDSFMVRQPRAHGVCFKPNQDARAVTVVDGATLINSWVPVYVPMRTGDVSPFLNHLKKLLPLGDDADILLSYLAALMQHKGVKFQWAPFIQGVEGNGKSLISKIMEYCVGGRYTHWPRADKLDKQFNAALYGKLLICVEDVKVSENKNSVWEVMKPMISGTHLEYEPKGVDSKVTRDFCANWILNSNHKDGIRKTKNDRRICPLYCAQQHEADLIRDGLTEEYFDKHFRPWLEKKGGYEMIAQFLNTYAIPAKWNPAGSCIRAPRTSATESAIKAGRGSIEQEVAEATDEGRPGFRGGWCASTAFDNLLAELGKTRFLPRNKRQELLEGMGYVLHPNLPDGRTVGAMTDGTRPRLFVLPGVAATLTNPAEITAAYVAAQSLTK